MSAKTLTMLNILLAAPALLGLGSAAQAQGCPKTGGTLTYAYSLEPSALSTIATSAVPVALIVWLVSRAEHHARTGSMTP